MGNFDWTKEQSRAIEEQGTDLLVSAAAGSGKTAVLTERIVRKLIDPVAPVDINDFLIVTFTVAATSELREKLAKAMRSAYQSDKTLKRLKKQILNLPSAKILTIDSFCKFIVNECTKQLGIPADFQLGEESELNEISNSVLSEVLDDFFDGYQCEKLFNDEYLPTQKNNFFNVVETFSTQKSFDSLSETIFGMYNKLTKYPEPMSRAKEYLGEYDKILRNHYVDKSNVSFFETKIGNFIIEEIKESSNAALMYFEEAEKALCGHKEMSTKYSQTIQNDIAFVRQICSANVDDTIELLSSYSPIRLSPYKSTNDLEKESQEKFKKLRESGKDIIADLKKKFPTLDNEKLFMQIADTFAISNELFSILLEFDKRLWLSKIERKVFSFEDIAQLAYKALVKYGTYNHKTRSFEKTDYATELSEKFHEILIDEYQDVNELQDTIFRAISNSHNRFMVGDIKQSIYKFRGATPEIFFEYRNTFSNIDSADGSPRIIALQNNFRSDRSVINFVNSLFDVIMNYQDDDVYTKEDFLTFSKTDDKFVPTEISVFEEDIEFEYVADQIMKYVSADQNIKFNDICILARKHISLNKMQKVLSEHRIPSDYSPSENFFKSYEIETIHSLLKVIDNPSNDVALLSVLTSPIFAFSPRDLLDIRGTYSKQEIYFSIRDYNGNDDRLKKKCAQVIKKLKYWRNKSRIVPSNTFVWWLYAETHLFSFIKKLNDANERKENLLTFYNLSTKYEEREFKGVTKFLNYLDNYINSNSKLVKKNNTENSVHLMTIHESKGLEFPICFYIDSNSPISRADEKKKIVMSESFGPTFAIPMGNLGGKMHTYAEKAAIAETRCDTVDEELRLLYVALTRAKNKIIITAKANLSKTKDFLQLSTLNKATFSHSLKNSSTIFKIIGLGMYSDNTFKAAIDTYCGDNVNIASNELDINLYSKYVSENLSNEPILTEANIKNDNLIHFSTENVEFALKSLGNDTLTHTPYKISVSNLREGLLDEGAVASASSVKKFPQFMSMDSSNISSFRGTAMHVFMQFCDFENCEINGTEAEAERLVRFGFLTEEQKNVLNHLSLSDFFTSRTYKEIKASRRVEREKRYTLLLPSSEFYSELDKKEILDNLGKKTLIQGVIDCYYINDDSTITLIDFKTDNVNKKDGENTLKERHSRQMMLYKKAIEEIEGATVSKAFIYSFCLSKEIEI